MSHSFILLICFIAAINEQIMASITGCKVTDKPSYFIWTECFTHRLRSWKRRDVGKRWKKNLVWVSDRQFCEEYPNFGTAKNLSRLHGSPGKPEVRYIYLQPQPCIGSCHFSSSRLVIPSHKDLGLFSWQIFCLEDFSFWILFLFFVFSHSKTNRETLTVTCKTS